MNDFERKDSDWLEKVIEIKRTSKKSKGGNRIGFSALVVAGNRQGKVGYALEKASDVASAIRKGMKKAREIAIEVAIKNDTIISPLQIKYKASRLVLKPAKPGTGLIAGSVIRAIAEAAGIKNLTAKIIGTGNKTINVQAIFKGFSSLS